MKKKKLIVCPNCKNFSELLSEADKYEVGKNGCAIKYCKNLDCQKVYYLVREPTYFYDVFGLY